MIEPDPGVVESLGRRRRRKLLRDHLVARVEVVAGQRGELALGSIVIPEHEEHLVAGNHPRAVSCGEHEVGLDEQARAARRARLPGEGLVAAQVGRAGEVSRPNRYGLAFDGHELIAEANPDSGRHCAPAQVGIGHGVDLGAIVLAVDHRRGAHTDTQRFALRARDEAEQQDGEERRRPIWHRAGRRRRWSPAPRWRAHRDPLRRARQNRRAATTLDD